MIFFLKKSINALDLLASQVSTRENEHLFFVGEERE